MGWLNGNSNTNLDPTAVAFGFKNWNFIITNLAGGTLTNLAVDSQPIRLAFGIPVSTIALAVTTAAGGTAPAGFYVGLAAPSKMIAQGVNVIGTADEAQLKALGVAKLPLGSTYIPNPADSPLGFYRIMFLADGLYGTPLQLGRTQPSVGPMAGLAGNYPLCGTLATGVHALPANGAAIVCTPTNRNWFVGTT